MKYKWPELERKLAAIEKLISRSRIRSGYYGFTVQNAKGFQQFLDVEEPSDDERGIRDFELPPSWQEIRRNAVPEKQWLQRYVADNARQFDLDRISQPQPEGPDFRCSYKGHAALVEVEVRWRNWFKHKHHDNPMFAAVDMLILLDRSPLPNRRRLQLPGTIRYINKQHFWKWLRKFPRPPHSAERNQARRRYLANLLHVEWNRHAKKCSPKQQSETCMFCGKNWWQAYRAAGAVRAGRARELFFRTAMELLPRNRRTGKACLTDFRPDSLRFALQTALRKMYS